MVTLSEALREMFVSVQCGTLHVLSQSGSVQDSFRWPRLEMYHVWNLYMVDLLDTPFRK